MSRLLEVLQRLAAPEDRVLLALLAIVVGYALWGAVLGWRQRSRPTKTG